MVYNYGRLQGRAGLRYFLVYRTVYIGTLICLTPTKLACHLADFLSCLKYQYMINKNCFFDALVKCWGDVGQARLF